jgi:hypothetical protein
MSASENSYILENVSLKGDNTIGLKKSPDADEQEMKVTSDSYARLEKLKAAFGKQDRYLTIEIAGTYLSKASILTASVGGHALMTKLEEANGGKPLGFLMSDGWEAKGYGGDIDKLAAIAAVAQLDKEAGGKLNELVKRGKRNIHTRDDTGSHLS